MASKLILDRSDIGVEELVAGWKDGGVYRVELEITQDSSSPNTADYTVNEVVDISAPEEEPVEVVEEPAPKKAPKGGMIPK